MWRYSSDLTLRHTEQVGGVVIEAEEVCGAANVIDLFSSELGQAGAAVVLAAAFLVHEFDQLRWIVPIFWIDGVCVPAQLKMTNPELIDALKYR